MKEVQILRAHIDIRRYEVPARMLHDLCARKQGLWQEWPNGAWREALRHVRQTPQFAWNRGHVPNTVSYAPAAIDQRRIWLTPTAISSAATTSFAATCHRPFANARSLKAPKKFPPPKKVGSSLERTMQLGYKLGFSPPWGWPWAMGHVCYCQLTMPCSCLGGGRGSRCCAIPRFEIPIGSDVPL